MRGELSIMPKNQKEEQNELRQWLNLLCNDPFTSILDETIFRIDVLETTEDYVVEAELSHCQKENIVVLCESHSLTIQIQKNGITEKQRNILLPFLLLDKNISAHFSPPILEVRISKVAQQNHSSQNHITVIDINE
jgi:spore coat protein M